ncbi:MAG: hypothetical protein JOS17DRAFT_486288 [Linnemannia elongata]|nr:MAG: hypothetical protein JOS17DRAFT_486288 [Linnemannia elongata]
MFGCTSLRLCRSASHLKDRSSLSQWRARTAQHQNPTSPFFLFVLGPTDREIGFSILPCSVFFSAWCVCARVPFRRILLLSAVHFMTYPRGRRVMEKKRKRGMVESIEEEQILRPFLCSIFFFSFGSFPFLLPLAPIAVALLLLSLPCAFSFPVVVVFYFCACILDCCMVTGMM